MINLSNILISNSFADTVSNATEVTTNTQQAGLMNFVPLILIFMVFYFLLVRPQQKKMKEHQKTLNHLKNGDKVQTSSGIFGTVKSIDDKESVVELEIATNVTIRIAKYSISSVLNQKTPVHKSNKK